MAFYDKLTNKKVIFNGVDRQNNKSEARRQKEITLLEQVARFVSFYPQRIWQRLSDIV
jgi:hypothetical protein